MKKRNIALVALFVVLGAGQATAADVPVINQNSSGSGSLNYAMANYNAGDTILFTFGADGNITTTGSTLPNITKNVTFALNSTLPQVPVNIINTNVGSGNSSLFRTSNSNVTITLPDNLSFYASGTSGVTALAGLQTLNIAGDDIGGTYSAATLAGNNDGAYAISGSRNVNISGNLTGDVKAHAYRDNAYGIRAQGNNSTNGDITVTGNISGNITAAADRDNALGLGADGSIIITGDTTGSDITATSGHDNAYGMRAADNISITGSLSGSVIATAGDDNAYGLFAEDHININGSVSGVITALAGYNSTTKQVETGATGSEHNNAYALYAENNINITGNLGGSITAQAGNDNAYGLRADDNININGNIGGNISAQAGGSNAYGLFADEDITINGNLGGEINVTAGGNNAYGLYADKITINGGDLIGNSIYAHANGSGAYGLYATGAVTDVNLDITWIRNKWGIPVGINDISLDLDFTNGNIEILKSGETGGNLTGSITAISDINDAYGLKAGSSFSLASIIPGGELVDDFIANTLGIDTSQLIAYAGDIKIDGNLDGNVNAEAGSGAYGLLASGGFDSSVNPASGSITIGGDLFGNVTANAKNGDNAYGLYAQGTTFQQTILASFLGEGETDVKPGNISLGALSGDVNVSAYGNNAYGLKAGDNGNFNLSGLGSINFSNLSSINFLSFIPDFAPGNITVNGDLSGDVNVATNTGSNAYGLSAGGNFVFAPNDGNINITGSLTGKNVYEGKSLGTPGGITVTSGGDNAFGLSAYKDISIGQQLSGDVTVTANGSNAFGLKAGNIGTLDIGTLSSMNWTDPGTIINYFFDFAPGNITIGGNLSGDIKVSTITGSNAYGLFAGGNYLVDSAGASGNININGSFTGNSIDVYSGGNNAYGMWAFNDINIGGDFAGEMRVFAEGDNAVGMSAGIPILSSIFGGGDITIGSVDVEGALFDDTGDFSGKIVTKAGGNFARGMFAANNINILDDITRYGKIITLADNGAFGLMAVNDITIGDDMRGDIITIAEGNLAGGLSAGGDISIGGELSGKIISVAKGDGPDFIDQFGIGAYGLGALGGIHGENPADDLDITGTIVARANLGAAAIVAFGPMNLDIKGHALVKGVDNVSSLLGSSILSLGNAADQVTVRHGATLVGNVNLGQGDDLMVVKDRAHIDEVTFLNGGTTLDTSSPENDELRFDGWRGKLGEVVINWESINVLNSSVVDLGMSKMIVSLADGSTNTPEEGETVLQPVNMSIDGTSTVLAKGNSPGLYVLVGNLSNAGNLDMMDNEVNDFFHATGNYTGTGTTESLWLDANLNTSGKTSFERLIVGGDVTGTTTVILNNVVSPVAVTEGDGIEIVGVGGTSSDNAFVLGNPDNFGPFAVDITRGITNTESWFVVSPGYREEAAVLQAVTPFVEKLGYESVPRFHERRTYTWFPNKDTEKEAYWVRGYGSKFRLGLSGDAATKVEGYSGGMQVGTDIAAGGTKDNRQNLGLYAGVGYMEGDVDGLRSDTAGKLNDTAFSIGLYATQHAPDKHFIEAVVQGSYHDVSIDYLTESKKDVNLWSYLASLETGVSIPFSSCFSLQPQAQLIYQHTDGFGISSSRLTGDVSIADHDGLQGRLGITGMFKSCEYDYNPFFEVNLIKDFSEDNSVTYSMSDALYADTKTPVTLSSRPETLFLGGAIGISRIVSEKSNLSYFLKAEAMYGLDGLGSYDYKLTAGLRKAW